MSVIIPATNGDGLYSNSNLSNPQNFTKLIWAQCAATPTSLSTLIGAHNNADTSFALLLPAQFTSGNLSVGTGPGAGSDSFPSQPTWTDWNCFALTGTTAGAGSLIGYWQDNAGGGFVSHATTGVSFTSSEDDIGIVTMSVATTVAYYMEWNTVLSPTQLQTQFGYATPQVATGNLSRYLALSSTSNAGTDTSGNGYNMTVSGTLSNGASLPTFPSLTPYNPPFAQTQWFVTDTIIQM